MCSILNDKHPAYCLLYPSSQIGIPGRLKTGFLPLHYIHYPVIVTRDSSQVYGYYSLCLFIYHAFQGIIVKLRRIRLRIHESYCGTCMECSGSRCRIGIGRHYHLIPFADAGDAEIQLLCCRSGIKAHAL